MLKLEERRRRSEHLKKRWEQTAQKETENIFAVFRKVLAKVPASNGERRGHPYMQSGGRRFTSHSLGGVPATHSARPKAVPAMHSERFIAKC